jgi:DNA-binding MarR family transcriptional regulator
VIAAVRSERRPVTISSFGQDLDPVLIAPARLFIVSLLAEMRWCEFGFVRASLGVTPAALTNQLTKLRKAGYVETHRKGGRRTWVRLTPEGCDQLTNHLEALQTVVSKAAELVAAGAATCDGSPTDV